ncbi:MAG TPA: protein kinase [Gemmatimonadales bacterium]|nr:protein kinase [Gemmatimonadales bacterium]
MPDLLHALQSRLAGRYRIERELGGGGMSRVFLAEETGLGRKVVIKLAPPDLAAVLITERFQREVRIAAGLSHPHIVPLLSAGEAGDLVYYTMPYIGGETLRSRLARDRELPVPEAVRLLREIADALVYAHGRGLVHRDIKPDNILLSHQHAVVTDFGIAKALAEAGGGGTLTATGMSIGTPAYMAPEQAAGDPQVDHRADLYAVGVLAYEMLAGEPPFSGPSPQALVSAHLTRAPTPVSQLRPAVPAALARIIHRCLEKRPADRYQSAAELLAALDAAPGTTPEPGASDPAGIARPITPWPVSQVLGWLAAAGAGVLAVAWVLRSVAGLPDWFFPAAVALVLVGFPIVLLATVAHNRHAALGATAVPRRLNLRNAVWGGVGAFTVLALVTGAYMALRTLGIGPVGTLVASGKLAERERVIIADFENRTRDPLLGPALTQAFRVDFSQSKLVSPVEADYVRRVLRRMQRPDSAAVTLTVAQEIAQREGFKAVIAGELQQVGPSLLVSARLVSASGEELAQVRATARDSSAILDAVDRVSRKLRERIGESLRILRASPPLERVTTASLDALRKYSQAVQAENRGDDGGTIRFLEESVRADTLFGMAWRKLGVALNNQGISRQRADEAIRRAFALRDRLTFRERILTESSYYSDVAGAVDSAVAVLQALVSEYPDDSWAVNNLGVALSFIGEEEGATTAYRRAFELEPENLLSLNNLYHSNLGLGRWDSAAAVLGEIRTRFAGTVVADEAGIYTPLAQRDFTAAEPLVRAQLAAAGADPRRQVRLLNILAGVLAIRGKLAEADRTWLRVADLRASGGQPGQALLARARRAVPFGLFRDDAREASRIFEEALRAVPLAGLPERDRPFRGLMLTAVQIGDRERAEGLLREFERSPGSMLMRARAPVLLLSRGEVLAMRAETVPQAIAALHRARRGPAGLLIDETMAQAFDRLGMPDSALHYYERWNRGGEGGWPAGFYFVTQPLAFFRMAELYEARGNREKAREFYGRFTELWREADPELQPRVREARRRLEDLVAEPAPRP